jgi:succinate dehydrogenase/fumarate reductase flavoprotein subunit
VRGNETGLLDSDEIVRSVQDEVFPFERNLFRTERGLDESLGRLDGLWKHVQRTAAPFARSLLRGREAAAMVATARFMYETARHRTETRGMHKREDFPGLDDSQQRRLVSGGIERIWVRTETDTGHGQDRLAS